MNLQRFGYLVRQNIGDPGSIKLRNVFPLISVLPKLPQLPYGVKQTTFSCPPSFSRFTNRSLGKVDRADMKAVLTKKYDPEDKSEATSVCRVRQESVRKSVL